MKIKNVLAKHKRALLKRKNVVGVGIGQKWIKGKNTGKQALLIFVSKKEAASALSPKDRLPKAIGKHQTDVVGRTGSLKAQGLTSRVRPLKAGYSCGHKKVTAGTIGGWFVDKDGDLVGLSNNHVLANTNRTAIGAVTVQPGTYDSPNWRSNRVGNLKDYVRIRRTNNTQDSAIFKPHPNVGIDMTLQNIGEVVGFNENIQVNDPVQKLGRTTGYSTGSVIATNATVWVQYDRGKSFEFDDQIITSHMSEGGDSGSLLCDMDGNAAGLLFAGSDTVTIHNRITYPKNRYGLGIYSPLTEVTSHTVLVDGVEAVYALDKIGDIDDLIAQLKQLAATGKTVNLTLSYQVGPD